ncbi:hypothetical protein [Aureliella helgolandensis]|uniref:Uncharacterized protein n=1 Tax=Aureliella helgolandensis TaxID=2527968 RepID=A0A518G4B7_9BACT|nr:hypothetical protein [Aureliella helgolandensis]QDV23432.1 hypothetical protein Q31a_17300 [Aureliella helgolandensis]
MPGRYTLLSKALATELATLLSDVSGLSVARRLLPLRDRTEFVQGETYVSVFAGDAGFEVLGRHGSVDDHEWEAIVCIQAAGPAPEPKSGSNAFGAVTQLVADDVDWGDSVFDLVERIKGFWRGETDEAPEGPLRDVALAGCVFTGLVHSPVYVPYHLEQLGILSVILQLTYLETTEGDEDE